ncbi:Pleckstrin homology domain-containing protein [Nemania sp. FL0031]|nr:Pleckstrin homology domain-containing protein [Nemania sp. FL0031]
MDPLSVTASVAGLLTAAHEVAKLLGPYVSASRETPSIAAHVREEAESTRAVLIGLQTLTEGFPKKNPPGGALVGVDQVVAIMTGGVLLFAELEGAVQGLVASPLPSSSDGGTLEKITAVWGISSRLPLRARLQWARREESLKPLLERLQGFKVSITAVLTLLQCDSDLRAEKLQADLAANVSALLESNSELSQRMMHLENAFEVQTIRSRRRQSIASVMTKTSPEVASTIPATASLGETMQASTSTAVAVVASSVPLHSEIPMLAPDDVFRSVFEFEDELKTSGVYRRARRDSMDFSFRSSVPDLHAWSMLSARTLAKVSVLSVTALPLDLVEVTNRHHYVDTTDQQLAHIAEETLSIPDSEPAPPFAGAIFDDCLKIYFQLVEIPGFKELFDVYRQSNRSGSKVILRWDDDIHDSLPPDDILGALENIFQERAAYWLLADKLGWNLNEKIDHYSSRSTSNDFGDTVSSFQLHCIDIGFKTHEISLVGNTIGRKDRVGFLKVLVFVSKLLERLVSAGIISPVNERDPDAPISRVKASSWLLDSAYRSTLTIFVHAQQMFVRDLLYLVSALEEASQRSSPLLADQPLISHQFFSRLADSEIGLLLAIERILVAPPRRHLWADTIHRWSTAAEDYASAVVEEKNIRKTLPDALTLSRHEDQDQRLIVRYLDLLPRLPNKFARTAQVFQYILDMLLADSAEIGGISLAQARDFAEAKRLVEPTLGIFNEKIRQHDLNEALKDLIPRVVDWKNFKVEQFGMLVQFDKLSVTTVRNGHTRDYHVYLFEHILLFFKAQRTPTAITKRKARPPTIAAAAEASNEPLKLQMKGRIFLIDVADIISSSKPESYTVQVLWRDDLSMENLIISFMTERHMEQWARPLDDLRRQHSLEPPPARLQTSSAPVSPPARLHDRPLLVAPAAKRDADNSFEPMAL